MNLRRNQRGATLLVALVMLVVLTLFAISAIRGSTTNVRIAGNMQMVGEASSAAQQAIEQTISTNFTAAPASAVINVDTNADGTADYAANVAVPRCGGSVPLKNEDLNVNDPLDQVCIKSSALQQSGIIFASAPVAAGQSWCLSQKWDVQAHSTSLGGGGADVTLHQGVSLRVPAGTNC